MKSRVVPLLGRLCTQAGVCLVSLTALLGVGLPNSISAQPSLVFEVQSRNLVKPSSWRDSRGKLVQCNFEQKRPVPGFRLRRAGQILFQPLRGAELRRARSENACPRSCALSREPLVLTVPHRAKVGKLVLPVTDSCGLTLSASVISLPAKGTASLRGRNLTYRTSRAFRNRDSMSIQVSNGREFDRRNKRVKIQRGEACSIAFPGTQLDIAESEPRLVQFTGVDSCGLPVSIERQSDPLIGELSIEGRAVVYSPDPHTVGSDAFSVLVRWGRYSSQILTFQVTIRSGPAEFAGIATSLVPYRSQLSSNEVRHLLRKAALGGNRDLFQIGITQGREALVEALLNYVTPHSVETTATARAESVRVIDGCARPQWFGDSNLNYWLYHMRYGNPLREHAALHLHDHFAIDLDSVKSLWGCATSWSFREHREKLHGFALGSFAGFTLAMIDDAAMSYWLDNRLNRYGMDVDEGTAGWPVVYRFGNQNFARELMELFTLGKFDPYSGRDNFTEVDIEQATRAVSGYLSGWRTATNPNLSLPPLETGIRGYNNWYARYRPHDNYGVETRYDSTLAYQGTLSLFQGIPDATVSRSFTPSSFTEYLLYEHPASSRNIAYSFFNRYAYVHPPEEVTNELATLLRSTQYDMKEFLRRVLNSSAMFSAQANGDCIGSPAEFLIGFVKAMNYPIDTLSSLATMRQALRDMNHHLLHAPNVFAWGMCGDNSLGTMNHGEPWLQNQMLLNRYRSVNSIIRQQDIDGVRIKDELFPTWNNPTAAQVLDRFEEVFNLPLEAAERDLIRMSYLDRANERWDPANQPMVRSRLAGLAFIFATHLKNMIH